MKNTIQPIPLNKLLAHPDNPNRMSKANFAKLVRNIRRTGRYEPLVVRPHPQQNGFFQVINGHHRLKALEKLGYSYADAVVWDIDDAETNILLATLNRLGGTDLPEKKTQLFNKLTSQFNLADLAKLLPATAKQIQRLAEFTIPSAPAKPPAEPLASPLVVFLTAEQKKTVERALALAQSASSRCTGPAAKSTALVTIAQHFIKCPHAPDKHPRGAK